MSSFRISIGKCGKRKGSPPKGIVFPGRYAWADGKNPSDCREGISPRGVLSSLFRIVDSAALFTFSFLGG